MAGHRKEYQLAIKIHGEMSKSLPAAAKLSKSELRAIAKEAAYTSKSMRMGFQDGLKSTEKVFSSIERVGVKAFKTMAQVSGTAFAAIGAGAVKVGSEYEAQMSTVKAISGAGQADFKALSDEAKNLGATTVFTAKEAGQAMEYEAMAGWKAGQMIKGTAGIMNLAAASGEDLASTADIVTDSLTAFNKKAKDSGHFSDVMAAAATNANTNVAKLGETFKYAAPLAGSSGFSVEDTALVAGTMANSGIKDSMAGTSIRSWITRMTKPTKESGAAMKELGINITNSEGKMKELSTIAEETRESFDGLSKKEKSEYAAMLAGKAGMSGLLALVNASEKDYRKLEKAIRKCDGAAEKMSKIKLDNLEGDIKLFTSAMQGAGIEIYEEIKEPLREVVQGATEWVGDFSKGFKTEFPTAIRMVKEGADAIGDFAEPLLKVGGWLVEHPDAIVGTITGIGTAVAGYKVASGLKSLAGGLSALGPAGWTVLGVAGAATAIAGIGSAMKVSQKMAADANLKRHFGDVALSMEELDAAARQIVGSKKLERVEELMSSLDKGDAFVDSMKDAMETVNKMDWKVEAGLKLKKGERKEYKTAVKTYVDNAQNYIDQQGYTVSVATKVLFGDSKEGKLINKDNNKWFSSLQTEANEISEKISGYLTKATKKGLKIKDTQKVVDGLISDLDDVLAKITAAEQNAEWNLIDAKYSGVDLNAESFKNLQKEVYNQTEKIDESIEDSYMGLVNSYNDQYSAGDLTKKKYDKKVKQAREAMYSEKADNWLTAYDMMYGKIQEKYGPELASAKEGLDSKLQSVIEEYNKNKLTKKVKNVDLALELQNAAMDYADDSGLSTDTKDAIGQLMTYLTPVMDKIETLNGQAQKNGGKLKDDTVKKLSSADVNMKEMNAFLYNTGWFESVDKDRLPDLNYVSGKLLAQNKSERDAILAGINEKKIVTSTSQTSGFLNPESFKEGFETAEKSAQKTYNNIKKIFSEKFSIDVEMRPIFTQKNVMSGNNPWIPVSKVSPKPHARGGIFSKPHLGLVAEAGVPESIIPIEPTKRSFSLWEQTGQMLGAASNNNGSSFRTYEKRLRKHAQSGLLDRVAGANSSGQTINITFSPNITIQGNADKEAVQSGIRNGYQEFEQYMKRFLKNKGRMALAAR